MSRIITSRGLRAAVPVVGLAREVKAAAKTTEDLAGRKVELVQANTPEKVEAILTENYLKQASDMVVSANPFVNEYAFASFDLVADSETDLADEQDLFKEQTAGAAGSGIAGIINSFRKNNEPDVAFILKNVGVNINYKGKPGELGWLLGMRLAFWQNDIKIVVIPLATALNMLIICDNAATPGAPIIMHSGIPGGGYEIEGGGFPILKTGVDTSCFVEGGPLPDPGTGLEGHVHIMVNFDGEPIH